VGGQGTERGPDHRAVAAPERRDARVSQAGEARSARIESLRALAALAVVVNHVFGEAEGYGASQFGHRLALSGGLAVFLFFALSGYLLFLPFARRDYGLGGAVDLRRYALNRALRILPLYYVVLAVLLLAGQGGGSAEQWWRFATFTESFDKATVLTVDGPMWSLVVELQFYALLPLVAWLLAKLSRGTVAGATVLIAAIGAASLAVWYLQVHRLGDGADPRWRYSLPVTALAFVPGMLLALVRARLECGVQRAAPPRIAGWLLLLAVSFWVLAAYRLQWAEPFAVLASFLVLAAIAFDERARWLRALEWRPLAALGVASYSLYLWHKPLVEWLEDQTGLGFVALLALALPICAAVAAASYLAIERPFLRLRRRWAPGLPAPEHVV
jgi:peptidoglycan/LPS O-acetylase OafA/YrhL